MAYMTEEFPNRLILVAEWLVKKQMRPEDAAKYAHDNNYSCFNYDQQEKDSMIYFYNQPYAYCKSLVFQERYYAKNSVTVLVCSS